MYTIGMYRRWLVRILALELLAHIASVVSFLVLAPILFYGPNSHMYTLRSMCEAEFFRVLLRQIEMLVCGLAAFASLQVIVMTAPCRWPSVANSGSTMRR